MIKIGDTYLCDRYVIVVYITESHVCVEFESGTLMSFDTSWFEDNYAKVKPKREESKWVWMRQRATGSMGLYPEANLSNLWQLIPDMPSYYIYDDTGEFV